MNLKKYTFILILILIFSCNISASKNNMEQNEYENIQKVVTEIYEKYVNKNFVGVYKKLYPGIKKSVTKDEYVSFQKKNFKKYKFKIYEVEVGEVQKIEELPAAFNEYLNKNNLKYFTQVKVKYKMDFHHLEKNYQKKVNKKVYIGVDEKNDKYLFWDPQPLQGD